MKSYRKLSVRLFATIKGRSTAVALKSNHTDSINPWKEQKDPGGSDLIYYWNTETNETTQLGASKPSHWIRVIDPNGSGQYYWWNPESDETTPLGFSKPANSSSVSVNSTNYVKPFGQLVNTTNSNIQNYQSAPQNQPESFGKSMVTYMSLGVGVTLGMMVVRVILGI